MSAIAYRKELLIHKIDNHRKLFMRDVEALQASNPLTPVLELVDLGRNAVEVVSSFTPGLQAIGKIKRHKRNARGRHHRNGSKWDMVESVLPTAVLIGTTLLRRYGKKP